MCCSSLSGAVVTALVMLAQTALIYTSPPRSNAIAAEHAKRRTPRHILYKQPFTAGG